MPWQDPSFDAGRGANVGSGGSQDIFCGYGTEFNNFDRFILDISDVIHMLGADQTKLISWMQAAGTMPTSQVQFTHMESEMFTVRDFKAKVVQYGDADDNYSWLLEMDSPQDWQAIETAALGDGDWSDANFPQIYMIVNDGTNSFKVKINKFALSGALNRELPDDAGETTGKQAGWKKDVIVMGSGAAASPDVGGSVDMVGAGMQEVSSVPASVGDPFVGSNWAGTKIVSVRVVTPEEHLRGMAQGSGLPNETRKHSRSLTNFVQIFKTPFSISNTLKAVTMRGGNELAMLRYRKAIQHKTAIERAMVHQGGGVEGTDYGLLATGDENPLTRFKGLGVGLAVTNPGATTEELRAKAGWIQTKNADWNDDFKLPANTTSPTAIHALMEKVFDDLIDDPSETKIMACSNKWLTTLANIAASYDTGFTMGDHTTKNVLGIPGIRTLTSPLGTLRLVPFKHLRGGFEDYAFVLDMNNIKYRPLRPTKLLSNVETDAIDGQKDYYITETGLQVMHESTHAVLKLT